MKTINNWLNTEIDNNYYNYNVIKLLYAKIKNYLENKDIQIIDENNFKSDFIKFLYKYSL